jgi:hypothetical protein
VLVRFGVDEGTNQERLKGGAAYDAPQNERKKLYFDTGGLGVEVVDGVSEEAVEALEESRREGLSFV